MGNVKNVLNIFTIAIPNLPTKPCLAMESAQRGNIWSKVFVMKVSTTDKLQTFISLYIKQVGISGDVLDSYNSVSCYGTKL